MYEPKSTLRRLHRVVPAAISLTVISAALSLTRSIAQAQTAPTPVLTQHNDNFRSGDYLTETALTPQNVNVTNFGKLWQMAVTGRIYTQPLYVPNVVTSKGTRNVVYITTALNDVYAYDADTPNTLYWKRTLGTPVPSSNYNSGGNTYYAVYPDIGILSTPVIDTSTNSMYVVADIAAGSRNQFFLHALNLSTGADEVGNGALIEGAVAGTGTGSSGGALVFQAPDELQRPALSLFDGTLFIEFGSHNDQTPSFGWMFAYSESNLSQLAVYCSAPNSTGLASFWNSGQGPAIGPKGGIFTATGNGPFDANIGGRDLGQTVIKLYYSAGAISILDYFTPWDYKHEDMYDEDLGSCGPLFIPDEGLVLQGGKDGHFYLLNVNNLGKYQPNNNDQIVQDFQACESEIHGSPVFWQSGANQYIYVWSQGDYLKQFRFVDGFFDTTPLAESALEAPTGSPGGMLSVSANGYTTGSGIVWVNMPNIPGGYNKLLPAVLRAYSADNVGDELWDSQKDSTRDAVGNYAKFVEPTIANNKVYVATDSGYVDVYGLLP